jgi:hypothetical protein
VNHYDSGMAAAEQDDAEGVLSLGAGNPKAIRAPCSSWHAHDSLAAATARTRACGVLEAVAAAWTGDRGHDSSMELIGAPKRAVRSSFGGMFSGGADDSQPSSQSSRLPTGDGRRVARSLITYVSPYVVRRQYVLLSFMPWRFSLFSISRRATS